MLRPIADQLREYAKHVADGSSTYCEAPIMLLEHAADLIDSLEARPPIDGTGWAEAAFESHEDALRRCGYVLKDGTWSKGYDGLVTDVMRGQGE